MDQAIIEQESHSSAATLQFSRRILKDVRRAGLSTEPSRSSIKLDSRLTTKSTDLHNSAMRPMARNPRRRWAAAVRRGPETPMAVASKDSKPAFDISRSSAQPTLVPGTALTPGTVEVSVPSIMLSTADMPIHPHEPLYCYCNQVSWGEVLGSLSSLQKVSNLLYEP